MATETMTIKPCHGVENVEAIQPTRSNVINVDVQTNTTNPMIEATIIKFIYYSVLAPVRISSLGRIHRPTALGHTECIGQVFGSISGGVPASAAEIQAY